MKAISFKNASATRIYNDHMLRCQRALKILSAKDREDHLLEVNSYIYEHMAAHPGTDELESLLDILERLGPPERTLKEVIAAKKLDQAAKTFNPKYLLQALFLNIGNGFAYVSLFVLYIFLFALPLLIVLKMLFPGQVGLFMGYGGNIIALGAVSDTSDSIELLGGSFIPVMALITVLIYSCIVLLLRMTRKAKAVKRYVAMSY